MNPLAQLLKARIKDLEEAEGKELSVQKIADRCSLDHWIVRDTLRGKAKRPRPEHLEALAAGLDIPLTDVVMAANTTAPAQTEVATA